MFEETVLEQTESILMSEMGRAAADAVTKSLLSLSSSSSSNLKAPSCAKDASESAKVKIANKEENALLNVTANWRNVSFIAGSIIESVSESKAEAEREQQWNMLNMIEIHDIKNINVGC